MRAIILSDIHGSAIAAHKALEHFNSLKCEQIWLLGDTLYHGPRNPLPEGHGPMGVVEALTEYKDRIVAVRGNCDADVDLMMLPFDIADEYRTVDANGHKFFLSHGHIFLPECFPADALNSLEPGAAHEGNEDSAKNAASNKITAYLSGHTHIWMLEKNFKGVLLVNPGSTSLPKGGNPPTFGLYDNGEFSIRELETGRILASARI